MVQTLLLEVLLVLEVIKYLLIYLLSCAHEKKQVSKTVVHCYAAFAVIVALMSFQMSIQTVYFAIVIAAMTLLFIYMDQDIIQSIWQCLVVFLSVTAIDSIVGIIFKKLFKVHFFSDAAEFIVWDLITVAGALCAYLLVLRRKRITEESMYDTGATVKLASIVADICLCLGGTLIIKNSEQSVFSLVFGTITLLSVAFLGSQIVGMLKMNHNLNEVVNQERMLRDIQSDYYQSVLTNENNTRKYRHDMINHFMVIESYLGKGKIESARKYIEELKGEFIKLSKKRYISGNDVIDAISGYYLPQIEDIATIHFKGELPGIIGISEISLCTVYSNLLKNAVEELLRLKDAGKENMELNVELLSGKRYIQMKIWNTTQPNKRFNGMKTSTSKEDPINHGIGLSSIMYAVQKENGLITLEQKGEFVFASVILPMHVTQTQVV